MGFTLDGTIARQWISDDAQYADVLYPYLNGKELNGDPAHATERWVITFRDWSEEKAKGFPRAYEQVLREVRPERAVNNRESRRNRWWLFAEWAPGLYKALDGLDQCIAITRHTHTVMPARVTTKQVFSDALAVIADGDPGTLAVLSSAPHYWWAINRGSTMKGDLRYTPTDVFETLVRPPLTLRLRTAGAHLETYRSDLMSARNMGLTATYNLVHNPNCQDEDVVELRRIHEEIDRATVEAYGWFDLLDDSGQTPHADPTHETFPLDHGFHETDQGTRYTIGLLARTEIIDRLRQLNHQAYADEVHLGLHKKPAKHPDMPKPSADAIRKRKEQLAARGGSDFGEGAEGALF
ncbi:type IIL restriction-modification enzyme MmeI [Streptomyces sp. NRRL S-1824]|uniref:type IIL restriction-modification enzyme MmeI n=1 Tax=Streptomyces sp. NRRL S-1824 TaxID=1463889 RepID=UPI002D21DF0F|nr:type IIL restriction-modification enzyme MmeI [Streptomyces sp. NRRL S-1824]